MPVGLLDTGVGGHIETVVFAVYEFVSRICFCVDGAEYVSGFGFCGDGTYNAGEETELCPFWKCYGFHIGRRGI